MKKDVFTLKFNYNEGRNIIIENLLLNVKTAILEKYRV